MDSFSVIEIVEYIPNTVVIKTIIHKITGDVTVAAVDSGESLAEKVSAFDTFIQVIDGRAMVMIDRQPLILNTGQAIIIPANTRHLIRADERFKLISTIIKSGYEDVI